MESDPTVSIIRKLCENHKMSDSQIRRVLIGLCERDLYLFAVRYFKHYLKSPSSKFHRYLYSFLSEKLNDTERKKGFKHAVAAPRASAKSSIISCIFVIWCICYSKKRFIVMCSDTATQAVAFLADIKRELLLNELLRQDFPTATAKGELWRTDEIITRNKVKVIALGTGNNIRGRKYGDLRPDLCIFDDLESSDMVRSKTQREAIRYDWFNKDVKYVGGAQDIVDFLVAGTILGPDSLLNNLMDRKEYPDWTREKFQAVIEFSTSPLWDKWARLYKNVLNPKHEETAYKFFKDHEEEMLEGTEVLWPEGDPYYNLMIHKLSDYSGFISEKQNDPLDPRKVLILKKDLTFMDFSSDPKVLEILESKRTVYYGAIDPSLGKSKQSDYSSIVTLARDLKTGLLLVCEISIKRRSTIEQVEDIIKFYKKYHYNEFGIEINSFQVSMAETLTKRSREIGTYIPVRQITNHYNKFVRIQGLTPLLSDGTIVFDSYRMERDLEYSLGMEQLCSYTESSVYDDFPDSLEMAVSLCRKTRFKMLTRQTRR